MDSTSIQFRSHTALLLAAALPYLQPAYRHPTELALKFLEFLETMKVYRELSSTASPLQGPLHTDTSAPGEKGIFELLSRFVIDPEGLLNNLSTVCTGKEKEIIGLLLNLLRAKSFYENYGDILSSFMSADDFPNPFSAQSSPAPDLQSTNDFSSMFNKEQTDTLNLLKSLLDAE